MCEDCLECVGRLFGVYGEAVWQVWGMSCGCVETVWRMWRRQSDVHWLRGVCEETVKRCVEAV